MHEAMYFQMWAPSFTQVGPGARQLTPLSLGCQMGMWHSDWGISGGMHVVVTQSRS